MHGEGQGEGGTTAESWRSVKNKKKRDQAKKQGNGRGPKVQEGRCEKSHGEKRKKFGGKIAETIGGGTVQKKGEKQPGDTPTGTKGPNTSSLGEGNSWSSRKNPVEKKEPEKTEERIKSLTAPERILAHFDLEKQFAALQGRKVGRKTLKKKKI